MNENEQKAGSVADQKSKIRERYKGINPDELDVIPALPQEDIFAVEMNSVLPYMQGCQRMIQGRHLHMNCRRTIIMMSSVRVQTGNWYRSMRMKASPAPHSSTVTSSS